MPRERLIELPPQTRTFEIRQDEIDEETRSVEISFSSEAGVERFFGKEILDHTRGAVDLTRLRNAAQLLVNHDPDRVAGVVDAARIADRQGRATVRFGQSAFADEIFNDVKDGIRKNVSVAYRIREAKLVESGDDGDTIKITRWEPFEVSIVSIPADISVGVGRDEDWAPRAVAIEIEEERQMPPENQTNTVPATPATTPSPADTRAAQEAREREDAELRERAQRDERTRTADILQLGRNFSLETEAEDWLRDGMSVEDANRRALEIMLERGNGHSFGEGAGHVDMEEREVQRYSITRALYAAATQRWDNAGFEREVSSDIAQRLGREPEGFFIPTNIPMGQRVLTAGGATAGQELVATDHLGDSFIEVLRNRMQVRALGAQVLDGLVGNIEIPKQTGAAVATFVAEDTNVADSQLVTGEVTMRPRSIGALTRYSRKLLMQSSPSVEALVRNDLALAVALGVDNAAVNGDGTGENPTGIRSTAGVGSVVVGVNGGPPTWDLIVEHETDVAAANADMGRLGYLFSAKGRGKLKTTEKASSTARFIWEDGEVNGYQAAVSNQVPDNLTKGTLVNAASASVFGNWGDVLIGEWGVIDILVNPFTDDQSRRTRVTIFSDVDIALRHAESMSVCEDFDMS